MAQTREPQGTEDTDMVTCRRCGFQGCNLSRDRLGGPASLTYTATAGTPDAPTVNAGVGCPNCGTTNYTTWQE